MGQVSGDRAPLFLPVALLFAGVMTSAAAVAAADGVWGVAPAIARQPLPPPAPLASSAPPLAPGAGAPSFAGDALPQPADTGPMGASDPRPTEHKVRPFGVAHGRRKADPRAAARRGGAR